MIKDELENKVLEEESVKDETIEQDEVVEDKDEDIQNIDLSIFNKKKFSINGDPGKILELDVSDLNIINRLKEQYPVLDKLASKVGEVSSKTEGLTDERKLVDTLGSGLKEIDTEMRKAIDAIFDSNVSEICVPSGSMYDPVGGKLRYEHLIDTLVKLYDENLTKEVKRIQSRVSKHTNKYTKKK